VKELLRARRLVDTKVNARERAICAVAHHLRDFGRSSGDTKLPADNEKPGPRLVRRGRARLGRVAARPPGGPIGAARAWPRRRWNRLAHPG
jgi:hypothetical protein